ncbi:MAG: hypothetical protein ACOX01_00730 [Methanobrevibacter boviskoreani]|nr:hypothetical protein [Methanobrevibacter sp. AbM4]
MLSITFIVYISSKQSQDNRVKDLDKINTYAIINLLLVLFVGIIYLS